MLKGFQAHTDEFGTLECEPSQMLGPICQLSREYSLKRESPNRQTLETPTFLFLLGSG